MNTYSFKAITDSQNIITGQLQATNLSHLKALLQDRQWSLIKARRLFMPNFLSQKIDFAYLHEFTHTLGTLILSGIDVYEALTILIQTTHHVSFRWALEHVAQAIHQGDTVGQAFSQESAFFDPLFLSIIEAGEHGGTLGAAFMTLSDHYRWRGEVSEKIKKAYRYPAFLLVLWAVAFYVLMTFLVPNMVEFLKSMDQELTLTTRSLLSFSNALDSYGVWILGSIGCIFLSAFVDPQKRLLHWILNHLPFIGKLRKTSQSTVTLGNLASLLSSGVSLIPALKIVQTTLKPGPFQRDFMDLESHIAQGHTFSQAAQNLFDPLALRMIAVGEKTGKLGESLKHASQHNRRLLEKSLDGLIQNLEPAMLLILGGLLLWIVLGTIYPLYDSFSHINM